MIYTFLDLIFAAPYKPCTDTYVSSAALCVHLYLCCAENVLDHEDLNVINGVTYGGGGGGGGVRWYPPQI